MKQSALDKAGEHLALAKSEISNFDMAAGFHSYEQAWSRFLSQASRFYSKLEQGSKGCGKSEAWFGRRKHERRKDQLLSYLHHARDCDEHSLELITFRAGSGFTQRFEAEKGDVVTATVYARRSEDGSIEFANPTVTTSKGTFSEAEVINPNIKLKRVTDTRFHDSFDPPKEHLGQPVNGDDPLAVAQLAITYLEQMLKEASQLPIRI